jgi:hypothetical protein
MFGLAEGRYETLASSVALPMLWGEVLTGFLVRARAEDQ